MQKQPNTTVIDVYTQFKSLVDELSELQTLPECSCGAAKELTLRVHLFLESFDNEQYSHAKETILNREPLPSLQCVFNQILWEESRFTADKERDAKGATSSAFHSGTDKKKEKEYHTK